MSDRPTALVLHAADPITRWAALCLGRMGVRLVLVDNDADALEVGVQDLQAQGCDARWIAADPWAVAEHPRVIQDTLERVGEVALVLLGLPADTTEPARAIARWGAAAMALAGQVLARDGGVLCLLRGGGWSGQGAVSRRLLQAQVSACGAACQRLAVQAAQPGVRVNAVLALPRAQAASVHAAGHVGPEPANAPTPGADAVWALSGLGGSRPGGQCRVVAWSNATF